MTNHIIIDTIDTGSELIPFWDSRIIVKQNPDFMYCTVDGKNYFSFTKAVFNLQTKQIEIGTQVTLQKPIKYLAGDEVYYEYYGSKLKKAKILEIRLTSSKPEVKLGKEISVEYKAEHLYVVYTVRPKYLLDTGVELEQDSLKTLEE